MTYGKVIERFKITENVNDNLQWENFLSFLIAAGIFHHCEKWTNIPIAITSLLIGIICFFSKTRPFGLFFGIIFFFTVTLFKFPDLANHSNIYLFVLLIIIFIHFLKIIFPQLKINFQFLKNSLLYSLIVVYSMAVIHKLNVGFFLPDTNCSTWFIEKLSNFIIDTPIQVPHIIKTTSPYLLLLWEGLMVFFLCQRGRIKNIGLALGILLHTVLGFGGFADFATLCYAFYILDIDQVQKFYNKKYFGLSNIQFILFFAISMSLFTVLFFEIELRMKDEAFLSYGNIRFLQGLFLLIGAFPLFLSVFHELKNLELKKYKIKFLQLNWKYSLIPIFVFIFSMSPYLGLRNLGAFAMFSNLKNVGGTNNHFFIPQLDFFPFLKTEVKIISTRFPHVFNTNLKYYNFSEEGLKLLLYKQKEHLQYLNSPLEATLLINGKTYHSKNLWEDPRFSIQTPPWYWRFLHIKPAYSEKDTRCIR